MSENVNAQFLLEQLSRFETMFGKRQPDPFRLSFCGMDVYEVPSDIRPVLRIRDEVPCTPEVRLEVNLWLLDTFGTRDYSPLARGSALMMYGNKLVMRKEDAVLLTNCHS